VFGIDPASPLFIAIFMFAAFLLAGGWALFRPKSGRRGYGPYFAFEVSLLRLPWKPFTLARDASWGLLWRSMTFHPPTNSSVQSSRRFGCRTG
jgi:hypothetical protein